MLFLLLVPLLLLLLLLRENLVSQFHNRADDTSVRLYVSLEYRNAYPLRPGKKSGALLHVSAENGTTCRRSRDPAYPRQEARKRRNDGRASHCVTALPPTTLEEDEGSGHQAHFSFSCLFPRLFHKQHRERRRDGASPSRAKFLLRSDRSPSPPRGGLVALLVTTSMNDYRSPRCVARGLLISRGR